MQIADLLRETLNVVVMMFGRIKAPRHVRVFGVQLHLMGLSVQEVVAVLDLFGLDRPHRVVWNWAHDLAEA